MSFAVEVVVGDTLFPREQLGAVPYAVEADNGVPPGSIISFGGETTPDGWLVCDGSALSSEEYPRLFRAIGTSWGDSSNDADPATDFNLPDMRGRFLRGVDQGAGRDPNVASRSASLPGGNEGDRVGSIEGHQFTLHNHGGGDHRYNAYAGAGPGGTWFSDDANTGPYHTISEGIGASGPIISSEGGSETRPINSAVNYIIKL
jgi:microcystin-dependent protein